MWEKPFELFKDEYETSINCLKSGIFGVTRNEEDGEIVVYRKKTGQPVFIHFLPESDTITYNKENKDHVYYQLGDIYSDEMKKPEEMPRKIVLDDLAVIQQFLNDVMKLSQEIDDNSEKEKEND